GAYMGRVSESPPGYWRPRGRLEFGCGRMASGMLKLVARLQKSRGPKISSLFATPGEGLRIILIQGVFRACGRPSFLVVCPGQKQTTKTDRLPHSAQR